MIRPRREMALSLRHGRSPLARTASRLLGAVVISLIALVTGPVASAMATPTLVITSPSSGAAIHDPTPQFEGTTTDIVSGACPEPFDPVTVKLYAGSSTEPPPVPTPTPATCFEGNTWTVGPAAPLSPGTYTAQAEQTELLLT